LIVNQSNLANLLTATGRRQDAEKSWRVVIQQQEKLIMTWPKIPAYHCNLARTQNTLAAMLLERSQAKQARDLLWAAIKHQTEALAAAPKNAAYRESLCEYYLNRAEAEIILENHTAASKTVAELLALAPANWQRFHRAACLLASCASLAANDSK